MVVLFGVVAGATFSCKQCNIMWTADSSCLHHHLHLAVSAGKWPILSSHILLLNCASSCSQSSAGCCGGALGTSWFSCSRYHYWLLVGQVPNILPLSARIYCTPFCFLSLSFYTLKALNNAQLMSQGPSSVTSQYSEYGRVWQTLIYSTHTCLCLLYYRLHSCFINWFSLTVYVASDFSVMVSGKGDVILCSLPPPPLFSDMQHDIFLAIKTFTAFLISLNVLFHWNRQTLVSYNHATYSYFYI